MTPDHVTAADIYSGLVSVVPVFFFLPSHITTARFLSDEQKFLALERIRLNNTGTQNTTFKWSQVKECFLDLKQWGFVLMVFCVSFVSGGIGAFGPLIIRGFGFNPYQTILFKYVYCTSPSVPVMSAMLTFLA